MQTRNRILAIAIEAFNEKGYHFYTLSDLAAFSNLSLDIKTCGFLQKKYPFVFRDMSVLEHKAIKDVMTDWSQKTIKRNIGSFAFAIEIGNMKNEPFDGLYYQLAVNAWMISYYWVAQKAVRKVLKQDEAEKMIWCSIIPHFTEKGMQAFKSYYGNKYLDKIGKSYLNYIEQKQLF